MEPLDHLQPLFCGGTTLAKNYILGFHVPQRTQYSPLGVDVPCLPLTYLQRMSDGSSLCSFCVNSGLCRA
jgi:hypothetical protein